jgi:hypothetical protein
MALRLTGIFRTIPPAMAPSLWTRGAGVLILLCAATVNQADEPQITPQAGVLVLRTGRVLRGEIVRLGDRYVVTQGGKDEVGVPADSVELQCSSLEEAYQQKRSALRSPETAADHLALGDWCLRYELLGPASEQLDAARQLEPDSPTVALFERRVHMAAQQSAPTKTPRLPAPPLVAQIDLDQFVRQMPAGTVEQYTNAIQPLLINRCGTSGCHGPNSSSKFHLDYPGWSRILPRRFTQKNLHATMQFIDKTAPQNSPLLTMATAAHGTCQHATLGGREAAQLRQLADWVNRCAAGRTPPQNLNSPDSLLMQSKAHRRGSAHRDVALPNSPPTPPPDPIHRQPAAEQTTPGRGTADNGPPDDATGDAASNTPAPAPAQGQDQDPFDPAIFNKRYAHRPR